MSYFRKRNPRPRYSAWSPRLSSIRISWLYLQMRSVRLALPVLMRPAFMATTRSAIVVSSVSPLRWLIMAVYWLRKAADQGVAEAQFVLGLCYAEGVGGLQKDSKLAVFWLSKAAEQGNEDAKEALRKLGR